MPETFTSLYFLAGIASVACFFLTGTLFALSLFAAPQGRGRLLRSMDILLLLMVSFLAWLGRDLLVRLMGAEGLMSDPEPTSTALGDWTRETLSVLIFAIATVFTSLMTAFASIRGGRPGGAFRALPWAVVGVRVVLAAATVMGLLSQASLPVDAPDAIPPAGLAPKAEAVLTPIAQHQAWLWPAAITLCLLAWMWKIIQQGKRRGEV